MRTLALGCVLVLVCVASGGRGGARLFAQPVPPAGGPVAAQPNPIPPYRPPIATGAVVELLDEGIEPLFQRLNNDTGGEQGTIAREDRDVFTGVEAARVTPMQKYSSRILGWTFRIVEKPTKAREFRYLRFAWKKIGGTGVMVQLHDPVKSWGQRLVAGQNVFGWQPAKNVAEKIPTEWEVVTVDLYKEFGALQITGIAFSPLDGTAALFDHIIMGRTVEDLDKVTDAALGRVKPAKALAGKERDALWVDLTGTDAPKAATALRAFLATAPDHVAFIREHLGTAMKHDDAERVHKLIAKLDAEPFDEREQATDDLVKLGAAAVDAVREAGATAPNDEVRYRCRVILKKLGAGGELDRVGKSARLSRAVRVLERAATPEARELLAEIADRKLAPEVASDAKAALARMPKP